MNSVSIYSKNPLSYEDEIPVFSRFTKYVDNYEKISADHIHELNKSGKNPFMDEKIWNQLENSTIDLLLKHITCGKILDIGVGTGRLLSKLNTSNSDFEKYGLDISLRYLNISKSKGIHVCMSLIEDMPYHDESFDVIVCTDVLEHVLDFNLCVTNILRVLKTNGLLLIRVPYKENLRQYLDYKKYEYIHLRNFDENLLSLQMEKIFNTVVIEHLLVGTSVGKERLKYSFLNIPFLMKFIRYLYSRNYFKQTIESLFYKLEINFLVRKS